MSGNPRGASAQRGRDRAGVTHAAGGCEWWCTKNDLARQRGWLQGSKQRGHSVSWHRNLSSGPPGSALLEKRGWDGPVRFDCWGMLQERCCPTPQRWRNKDRKVADKGMEGRSGKTAGREEQIWGFALSFDNYLIQPLGVTKLKIC